MLKMEDTERMVLRGTFTSAQTLDYRQPLSIASPQIFVALDTGIVQSGCSMYGPRGTVRSRYPSTRSS